MKEKEKSAVPTYEVALKKEGGLIPTVLICAVVLVWMLCDLSLRVVRGTPITRPLDIAIPALFAMAVFIGLLVVAKQLLPPSSRKNN